VRAPSILGLQQGEKVIVSARRTRLRVDLIEVRWVLTKPGRTICRKIEVAVSAGGGKFYRSGQTCLITRSDVKPGVFSIPGVVLSM